MRSLKTIKMLETLAAAKFRRSDEGQDLLEYGLLMALIAIIAIGAVGVLGVTISNVFWNAIAASF